MLYQDAVLIIAAFRPPLMINTRNVSPLSKSLYANNADVIFYADGFDAFEVSRSSDIYCAV